MFFRSLSVVLINVTPFVCFVLQEQKKTFFKQKHILERGWLDNRAEHLGNAESQFIIETSNQLNGVCNGKQQRKQQSTCSLKKIYDILKIQISKKITLWCNFFLVTTWAKMLSVRMRMTRHTTRASEKKGCV